MNDREVALRFCAFSLLGEDAYQDPYLNKVLYMAVGSVRKAQLDAMARQATVDCYHEAEQLTDFFTMIDESLVVPFETQVLGVHVVVEGVDRIDDGQIVHVPVWHASAAHLDSGPVPADPVSCRRGVE